MSRNAWIWTIIIAVLVIAAVIIGIVIYQKSGSAKVTAPQPNVATPTPNVGSSQYRAENVRNLNKTFRVRLGRRV